MAKTPRKKCERLEDLTDILSASQIAEYLGVHRDTVYKLFRISPEKGGIPNFTIGRPDSEKPSIRTKREWFLTWLSKKTVI